MKHLFLVGSTITWHEREHSAIDNQVMEDQNALDALRGCGLLEFFKIPNMKVNTRLLVLRIHYWSAEEDAFVIDKMPQRIKIEDIYFITGLYRRGEIVQPIVRTRGSLSVEDYTYIYYRGNVEKVGIEIPIKYVECLSLIILLFTISRVKHLSFFTSGFTFFSEPYNGLSHYNLRLVYTFANQHEEITHFHLEGLDK